ncbi:MAG TPA: hypothetical protein VFT29_19850 [Gemmatimonadaceae bacterium]|nr:hypothetical protein [Gemmatimonadaceae bacterium]
MKVSTIAVLPLVLAFAGGCNGEGISGSPAGFPHATAERSCGPADGPAVLIYLTSEPFAENPRPPYVVVFIERSVDQLAGQSFSVGADPSQARATRALSTTQSVAATSGTISIESVSTDKAITGSVNLLFPVGRTAGRFTAAWIERFMLCG